jgi:hypothetical protein
MQHFKRKVRHERGAFFFDAVLAHSRPAQDGPWTDGGDRAEGGHEALPGSHGGVIISRVVPKVPDYGPPRRVGLPQDVG